MPDIASRRGAVDMGTVLMVVAFAVIGGFLYWLSGQAAAERAGSPEPGIPEPHLFFCAITSLSSMRSTTELDGGKP